MAGDEAIWIPVIEIASPPDFIGMARKDTLLVTRRNLPSRVMEMPGCFRESANHVTMTPLSGTAVHRVGVDIIEIGRIQQALSRWQERFLYKIYTDPEIGLSKKRPRFLAARFAGKEAVMKALGTGAKGVGWREIEILSRPSGEPYVSLYGNARAVARNLGLSEFAISLSHSRDYAVAVAVAQTR